MSNDSSSSWPSSSYPPPQSGQALGAFDIVLRAYRLVVSHPRALARASWCEYLGAIAVLGSAMAADAALFDDANVRGFGLIAIPLAGLLVLRFAVRWHRGVRRRRWPRLDDHHSAGALNDAIAAYGTALVLVAGILAVPLAAVVGFAYVAELSETVWLPALAGVAAVDLYLAARMSILLAMTAETAHMPPLWAWRLTDGAVGRLATIVALSMIPFCAAVAAPALWAGVPLAIAYLLVPVEIGLYFFAAAVTAAALTEALYACAQRSGDLLLLEFERARERDGFGESG